MLTTIPTTEAPTTKKPKASPKPKAKPYQKKAKPPANFPGRENWPMNKACASSDNSPTSDNPSAQPITAPQKDPVATGNPSTPAIPPKPEDTSQPQDDPEPHTSTKTEEPPKLDDDPKPQDDHILHDSPEPGSGPEPGDGPKPDDGPKPGDPTKAADSPAPGDGPPVQPPTPSQPPASGNNPTPAHDRTASHCTITADVPPYYRSSSPAHIASLQAQAQPSSVAQITCTNAHDPSMTILIDLDFATMRDPSTELSASAQVDALIYEQCKSDGWGMEDDHTVRNVCVVWPYAATFPPSGHRPTSFRTTARLDGENLIRVLEHAVLDSPKTCLRFELTEDDDRPTADTVKSGTAAPGNTAEDPEKGSGGSQKEGSDSPTNSPGQALPGADTADSRVKRKKGSTDDSGSDQPPIRILRRYDDPTPCRPKREPLCRQRAG